MWIVHKSEEVQRTVDNPFCQKNIPNEEDFHKITNETLLGTRIFFSKLLFIMLIIVFVL